MAKWGEGDPRWIVEDRPDAVNVNNWHWTEKNASHWSKDKLISLIVGMKVEDPAIGQVEFTQVSTIDGEAVANNRKAKLIFFYEWLLKGLWVARLKDDESVEIEGEFEIPNLSEENEPHEVDVSFSISKGDKHKLSDVVKEMLRSKGRLAMQAKIAEYVKELKEEYAKDLILPTKDQQNTKSTTSKTTTNTSGGKSVTRINNSSSADVSNGGANAIAPANVPCKTLRVEELMKCKAEEFFRCLTDPQTVSAFTQSKAIVEPKVGGEFVLFDGQIHGSIVEMQSPTFLRQRWRFKAWPAGHYSDVCIRIEQRSDDTLVVLEQSGVPVSDFERTENGWRRFYFDAMKRTFGFGSTLF